MSSEIAVNMKLCQGIDVLERMNYLYQASRLMAIQVKNPVAASYYGNIMVGCAKKAVLRMSPDVKRTVCKCCQSPLVPGETARVRLVSKPTKMVKWTCLTCNATKKFPTKKGYKLWVDQPEALVEIFDYTPEVKEIKPLDRCEESDERVESKKSSPLLMDCETLIVNEISVNNEEISSFGKERGDENILKDDKDTKNECCMILN